MMIENKEDLTLILVNEKHPSVLSGRFYSRKFVDGLALVLAIKEENERTAILAKIGFPEEEAFEVAQGNLRKEEVYLSNQILPYSTPMYALTNKDYNKGAALISRQDIMQKFYEEHGAFWILPSSIHEVLLVPIDKTTSDANGLVKIIREVNEEIVSDDDFLSDNLYIYEGKEVKKYV